MSQPIFLEVKEYCDLLLAAEYEDRGEKSLEKIVHMPLDPDILLWVYRAKFSLQKDRYSRINTCYTFDQIQSYAMDQAKRQIFYFSQMLSKKVYSKKQLEQKMKPYTTAETGKRVLARVMLFDRTSVIPTEGSFSS